MMPDSDRELPERSSDLAAVVLAAGAGTRLRPLTLRRPKPLCPVANVPLIDHAIARARTATDDVAVNLHHGREALGDHLEVTYRDQPVHLSVETPEALGTAGALGQLRPWIDGRDVMVLNADTWCPGSLAGAVAAWDRERVCVLLADETTGESSGTAGTAPADGLLGNPKARVAGAFMPWEEVARLEPMPSGLYEVSWGGLAEAGRLATQRWDGPCLDCGTPARYLEANLSASEGKSVVGEHAVVHGVVERSVIWDGAAVRYAEHLVDAIRTDTGATVLVR